MAECLYEDSNWRELSLDLQKATLMMIQNMQIPIYYNGFGVAVLNLEAFVTVRKVDLICEWLLNLGFTF